MPRWRNRECERCKKIEHTASKSPFCLLCSKENVRDQLIQSEKQQVVEWGYKFVSGPARNKFNKSVYRLISPCCGNEYEVVFNNLRKQVQNAKDKNLHMPCGTCGPQHRMKTALDVYVEKHGMDPTTYARFQEYSYKTRRMTERTYRHYKHIINPLNLKRGKKDYHLDHIIPIIECFKRGWTPEKAADASNLQMLVWQDNLSKGGST